MTELSGSEECNDCNEHDGSHCRNSISDHYGHAIAEWHPVCPEFSAPEPPEPPLCKECSMEYVEEKGGVCPDCRKKKPWKY